MQGLKHISTIIHINTITITTTGIFNINNNIGYNTITIHSLHSLYGGEIAWGTYKEIAQTNVTGTHDSPRPKSMAAKTCTQRPKLIATESGNFSAKTLNPKALNPI